MAHLTRTYQKPHRYFDTLIPASSAMLCQFSTVNVYWIRSGLLTATTDVCSASTINAENRGVIVSSVGGASTRSCSLKVLKIPQYSMIEIEFNELNLPLTCCPNNSPTIQCNSVTITVGSRTRKICNSSSPLYIYNEKAPFMEVTFLSTNFSARHEFNITYKGKWLSSDDFFVIIFALNNKNYNIICCRLKRQYTLLVLIYFCIQF